MKTTRSLLLTALCIVFFGGYSQAQKKVQQPSDYDRGYYLLYYQKLDSAFLLLNRYVNNADDTLKKAKAHMYLGEMQWNTGDLYGAQESFFSAIKTLDPTIDDHRKQTGYAYSMLGNISRDLKQFNEAIRYFNQASFYLNGDVYIQEVMNNKALVYQKIGNYPQAVAIFDSIVGLQPTDQSLVARVIDNRAWTKWLESPRYNALPEFQSALKIRADSQYTLGLNASYAHLSEYYAPLKTDSALWYAHKMYEQATYNKSPADVLEAMDKLIRFNSNPALKETWYTTFKKLNDSLQLSRDTTRNRFAEIRYGVQKSKADNLLLQQDITRQQLLLGGLLALAGLIIAGLVTSYKKRRKKIAAESENAIRNARLKTSQKVHDVVANGLYCIMNELEHRPTLEREPLMAKIENLYEKSRNISYEDVAPRTSSGYDREVHDLLTAYANEQTKVIIVGNEPAFWNNISPQQKEELQLVLNEIMVNMKKHSRANNVVIVFKQADQQGFVTYKDDGQGLHPAFEFGNGLNNTVSRIKSLNGAVNFEKNENGGLSIAISFPLQLNHS